MDWKTFWDRPNAIYANERHREAHYAAIASDVATFIPSPDAVVLDHGSGEALFADRVAEKCGALHLLDAAPSVRAKLAERFRDHPKIKVLAPEDLDGLPGEQFDLIVANSLLQYLSADDLDACFGQWKRALKPTGRLVLADVIPPNVSPVTDAAALLRFAAREKFLGAAIGGLARTALSPYRTLRKTLGLSMYTEGAMLDRLAAAGFRGVRTGRNLGHNPARMTFIARLV